MWYTNFKYVRTANVFTSNQDEQMQKANVFAGVGELIFGSFTQILKMLLIGQIIVAPLGCA